MMYLNEKWLWEHSCDLQLLMKTSSLIGGALLRIMGSVGFHQESSY